MPAAISVTFRDQITGRINDLLIDEHKACAESQNLLGYLAGSLVSYKDEGVEFAPSVLLCDDIAEVLKAFPGSVFHQIGKAALDSASGPKILKECAPLSGSNWFIYVERDRKKLNYGVFTYLRLPTAIPLHEGIFINPNQFCVLVRKISTNTIEMRGAKGSELTLIFSTVRASANSSAPIQEFATACCLNVEQSLKKHFSSYFLRLVEASLTSSHGTILICGDAIAFDQIPEMQDAVVVEPMLDFQAAFSSFQTLGTADSILNLQRCEELLQGFLRCDGIVAFDTKGRVTTYRIFFRPNEATNKVVVVGGARRRAFEAVKKLVGKNKPLKSVLFRSQDGLTLHHGVKL
jgi:hypothetical protein